MTNKARKITLSKFAQTKVVQPSHFEATEITLPTQTKYHVAHITQNSFEYDPTYGTRETKSPVQFNLYPLVVDSYGVP
ncbi:hypothetical protein [Acinetobacter baumannii]|nr:hypothetical protein [Acinetobacter baumannii]